MRNGDAQDTSALIAKFTKVDGHYERIRAGVPVLGLITRSFVPNPCQVHRLQ